MPSINQILIVFLKIACEITGTVYLILWCAREILERASLRNESLPEAAENAPSGDRIERLQSRALPTPSQTRLRSPGNRTDVEVLNQSPSEQITISPTDLKAEQETTFSVDSQKSGTGSQKGSVDSINKFSVEEAGNSLDPSNSIPVDHLRSRASTSQVQESGIQHAPIETVDDPRRNEPKTPKKTPKTPQKTPKSKTPKGKFRRSHSQASASKKSPETDGKRNLFGRSREQTLRPDVTDGYRQYDSSSTGEEQIVPKKHKAAKAKVSRTKANEEKPLASDNLAGRHTETDISAGLMHSAGESVLKASSLESLNRRRAADLGDGWLQNAKPSYKPLDGETTADPQESRDSSQSDAAEHKGRFEANSRTETESLTRFLPCPFPKGDSVRFPDVDIGGVDDAVKTFRDFESSIKGGRPRVVVSESSSLSSASSTDSEKRKYVDKMINQMREYVEDIARNEESARSIASDLSCNTLLEENVSASGLEEASAGCFPSPGESMFELPGTESPTDDADSSRPAAPSSLPVIYQSDFESSMINSGDDIKAKKPRSAPTTDSERHEVGIVRTCGPSSSNHLIIEAERVIEENEMALVRKRSVPTQSKNSQTEANREQESQDEPCKQVEEHETSAIRLPVTCPSPEIEENKGMELVKECINKNVDENVGTVDVQYTDSDDSSLEDKATKKAKYSETDL